MEIAPPIRFAERLVRAVQTRDVDSICALHHPEIEMESVASAGTVIRGAEPARRQAERLLKDLMLAVQLSFVEPLGDDLALVHLQRRVSLPPNGHKVDSHVLLWQLQDGLLRRQYVGTASELRARAAALIPARGESVRRECARARTRAEDEISRASRLFEIAEAARREAVDATLNAAILREEFRDLAADARRTA